MGWKETPRKEERNTVGGGGFRADVRAIMAHRVVFDIGGGRRTRLRCVAARRRVRRMLQHHHKTQEVVRQRTLQERPLRFLARAHDRPRVVLRERIGHVPHRVVCEARKRFADSLAQTRVERRNDLTQLVDCLI